MSVRCTLDSRVEDRGVVIEVTAANTGTEPVELSFRDGQTVEVDIDDGVWRFGAGRAFTMALRTETLAPGETLVETVTWEDATRGEHTVRAWLCADDIDCEATATVTV